jgi:hypothetical protein
VSEQAPQARWRGARRGEVKKTRWASAARRGSGRVAAVDFRSGGRGGGAACARARERWAGRARGSAAGRVRLLLSTEQAPGSSWDGTVEGQKMMQRAGRVRGSKSAGAERASENTEQ